MGTGPTRRTQRERALESSQRVITAAVDLFAEKGFARTTAAEIGERAGFSRSMVRAKYGTKDALLTWMLETHYEPRLLAPSVGTTGLEQAVNQVVHLAAQADEDPELMRSFFVLCFETAATGAGPRPWVMDWLSRYAADTAAALRRGQSDGSVRVELDPEVAARDLMYELMGHALRWALDPSLDLSAEIRQCSTRAEAAFACRPTTRVQIDVES